MVYPTSLPLNPLLRKAWHGRHKDGKKVLASFGTGLPQWRGNLVHLEPDSSGLRPLALWRPESCLQPLTSVGPGCGSVTNAQQQQQQQQQQQACGPWRFWWLLQPFPFNLTVSKLWFRMFRPPWFQSTDGGHLWVLWGSLLTCVGYKPRTSVYVVFHRSPLLCSSLFVDVFQRTLLGYNNYVWRHRRNPCYPLLKLLDFQGPIPKILWGGAMNSFG